MEFCDLTILMPRLNEAETIVRCIEKAREGLKKAGVAGEILIADNGSTDGSIELAEKHGARVVNITEKGYGNALRGGIEAARGKWIVMGDADDSYDFSNLTGFVEKLHAGNDLVMGCRLPGGGGTIISGAMPWKNRWIGNPVLSFLGGLFFKTPIRDFHCGLRALTRNAFRRMKLTTTGMEFASEMVIKSTLLGLRITEVPITLSPDGRSRPPHLRPWRDGWRHLRFMLVYSPRWLFLMPGLLLIAAGSLATAVLCLQPRHLIGITFDVGTLLVASMAIVVGIQFVSFACFTKVFAIAEGLMQEDPKFDRIFRFLTLERGIAIGAVVLVLGAGLFLRAVWAWKLVGFGSLPYGENLRALAPAVTAVVVGIQIISSSFFMSVLGLKIIPRRVPA